MVQFDGPGLYCLWKSNLSLNLISHFFPFTEGTVVAAPEVSWRVEDQFSQSLEEKDVEEFRTNNPLKKSSNGHSLICQLGPGAVLEQP